MMSTLSAADQPDYLAVKSVILNPANPEKGLPQINGLIMILDSDTGVPRAIVDGNWVTGIRTAGASAVVASKLARKDSESVAFIGCGVQAQCHLKLLADMFPLRSVHAFGRGETNRQNLCNLAESLGLQAHDHTEAKACVEDADIIISSVTMTVKIDPFVDPAWLKPGVFVSSTDMAIPFMPGNMNVFDQIIIDDQAQEESMADPMVAKDLISGDITGLLTGKAKLRQSDDERHAFIFRAVGLGDLALSALAYDKALEKEMGVRLG